MATKTKTGIVFTTKEEKPFKGAQSARALKARKMVQPRCNIHFPGDGSVSPFAVDWEQCEKDGHDPYFTATQVATTKPKTEEREDGKTYVIGEETTIEYVRTPNWEQVPDELGIYSGRGVPNSLERGFKFPEDLGYAPFCDYLGCGEQNPRYRTRFGNYHSREEAATMGLKLDYNEHNDGTAVFTPLDQAALNRQLREKATEEGF